METLAYFHLALAYEEPNPSPNLRFKDTDLRAASSVAMGFIASGIVASTLTCADVAGATLYYGSRGADVAKLQEALGNIAVDGVFGSETLARLKSYQAKKGFIIDGIAGAETLSTLGWSSSSKISKGQDIGVEPERREPEQYGRLHLINDTPYMAVVCLYEPGEKKASRYAYIPPYAERTLLDTYSSSWQVSFNKYGEFLIADLLAEKNADKENDVFKVKLSKLNKEDIERGEHESSKALKAKPVSYDIAQGFLSDDLLQWGIEFINGELPKRQFENKMYRRIEEEINQLKPFIKAANKNTPGEIEALTSAFQTLDKSLINLAAYSVSRDTDSFTSSGLNRRLVYEIEKKLNQKNVDFNNYSNFKKRLKEVWSPLTEECEELFEESVKDFSDLSEDSLFLLQKSFLKKKEIEEFKDRQIDVILASATKLTSNVSNKTVEMKLKYCDLGESQLQYSRVNFTSQSQMIPNKCI
jgi:hypothetical protein